MMKINLGKINKVLDYIANGLWAGILIMGVIGLLYSNSGMEALLNLNIILISSLILFYSCYVEDLKNKNAELEDKNNKLQLQVAVKDLVNSGLQANLDIISKLEKRYEETEEEKEIFEAMTARRKEIEK